MGSYNELYPANYYLIKENENAGVELVFIPMVTGKCVLVEYQDEDQTIKWFKKTDPIYEVIETLTEEQAVIYESLFEEEEEDDFADTPWDESEDPASWFDSDDDEDEEDDDKVRAINN